MHKHTYTCARVRDYINSRAYTHTRSLTHTYTYAFTYIHALTYKRTNTYMHLRRHIHAHSACFVYTHININTHIHCINYRDGLPSPRSWQRRLEKHADQLACIRANRGRAKENQRGWSTETDVFQHQNFVSFHATRPRSIQSGTTELVTCTYKGTQAYLYVYMYTCHLTHVRMQNDRDRDLVYLHAEKSY